MKGLIIISLAFAAGVALAEFEGAIFEYHDFAERE